VIDANAGHRDVVGQPVRVIPDDPIPPGCVARALPAQRDVFARRESQTPGQLDGVDPVVAATGLSVLLDISTSTVAVAKMAFTSVFVGVGALVARGRLCGGPFPIGHGVSPLVGLWASCSANHSCVR
jgi:hypothetical protein